MWMMSFIINNNGVRIGCSCIVGYDGIDIGIIDFVVNCYGGIDIGIGNGRSSACITIKTNTIVTTLHITHVYMATRTVASRRLMAMSTTAATTLMMPLTTMTSSSAARTNESLIRTFN